MASRSSVAPWDGDRTAAGGLTGDEATKLLEEYGPNAVEEKRRHWLIKLGLFFVGPIPFLIEIAAVLSAILQDWEDFFVILLLLLINAFVGFFEQRKADNALQALKSSLASEALVIRDGGHVKVSAADLVPGDLVVLRGGNVVPADVVLRGDHHDSTTDTLVIDESALTGESLPVTKHDGSSAYGGGMVVRGEMVAQVTATGIHSFLGKAASLVASSGKRKSNIQKKVQQVANVIMLVNFVLVAIVLVHGIVNHVNGLKLLAVLLVLTVAAIPVAMPTVMMVTLAVGAHNLSKRRALVTNLVAVEELASVDILCSDKTGTLTKNELTMQDPKVFGGHSVVDAFTFAALCSNDRADAIDGVVIRAFEDRHASISHDSDDAGFGVTGFERLSYTPFDPAVKRTAAVVSSSAGIWAVSKGAPQVIFELCNLEGDLLAEAGAEVNRLAQGGYRSLAVAADKGRSTLSSSAAWELVAIFPIFDPPRDDSKATIARCQSLGISVKMITGDRTDIAAETARLLGMAGSSILPASALTSANGRAHVNDLVVNADGFGGVFPEHKHLIVEALQASGHFVAMTGDGVNDAPAIKQSNCGIAVSNATDAAKAAASVVLLDPGLSGVVDAVAEARMIFARMQSYVRYRLIDSFHILLFLTATIVFLDFALKPVQIVLIALLNDGAILTISLDNVRQSSRPTRWNMKVLGVSGLSVSTVMVLSSIIAWHFARSTISGFGLTDAEVQTFVYLQISVAGHLVVFTTRSARAFYTKPLPSIYLVVGVFGTQVVSTLIAVYGFLMDPIGWEMAGWVWLIAVATFAVVDPLQSIIQACFDGDDSESAGFVARTFVDGRAGVV